MFSTWDAWSSVKVAVGSFPLFAMSICWYGSYGDRSLSRMRGPFFPSHIPPRAKVASKAKQKSRPALGNPQFFIPGDGPAVVVLCLDVESNVLNDLFSWGRSAFSPKRRARFSSNLCSISFYRPPVASDPIKKHPFSDEFGPFDPVFFPRLHFWSFFSIPPRLPPPFKARPIFLEKNVDLPPAFSQLSQWMSPPVPALLPQYLPSVHGISKTGSFRIFP